MCWECGDCGDEDDEDEFAPEDFYPDAIIRFFPEPPVEVGM